MHSQKKYVKYMRVTTKTVGPRNAITADQPGFEVIKLFLCSTQLGTKFILLINVKMPTIVGILIYNCIINKHMRSLKQETSQFANILDFMSNLNFVFS